MPSHFESTVFRYLAIKTLSFLSFLEILFHILDQSYSAPFRLLNDPLSQSTYISEASIQILKEIYWQQADIVLNDNHLSSNQTTTTPFLH